MPTIMSGCGDNVTTPLTELIVSCGSTAGGLILIGTSTAHEFATCDQVIISGVTGTTEANGNWEITVVDSSHFTLNGSTFVHAYAGSGSILDTSLTPAFQVPSDGDDDTAESILAALQALADRTQYLAHRINVVHGPLTFLQEVLGGVNDPTWGVQKSWTTTSYNTANSLLIANITNAQVGDVMSFEFVGTASVGSSTGALAGDFRLESSQGAGSITAIPGSTTTISTAGGSITDPRYPMTIAGQQTVTTPGAWKLYIDGFFEGGSAASVASIVGSFVVRVRQYRPLSY